MRINIKKDNPHAGAAAIGSFEKVFKDIVAVSWINLTDVPPVLILQFST